MTLTNEQRAHDLAVATLPVIRDSIARQRLASPNADLRYDAYDEYVKLYKVFLFAINRDFS